MSTRLEELTEQQKKLSSTAREKEKALVNTAADTNRQIVTDDYNAQIADTEQSYNELFDQNEVQKIINERQIAENMANMGLTDSGLNRTQMTAAQLSHSNNQAKINRQRQAAVDTLARAMNAQLAEIESNRAVNLQSIDSAYDKQAVSNATSIYNTEQEQETEKYKVGLDAVNTAEKQYQDDYKQVLTAMTNGNLTADGKNLWKTWFGNKYGLGQQALDNMFGSVNTQTAYTSSGSDSVTGDSTTFTPDMVSSGSDIYIQSGESQQTLLEYVDRIALENNWDIDTEQKFYSSIKNRTDGIRAFSANPTLLQYTLVSQPENNTYTGDIANTAVVKDQFGIERTIEDVYYMIKRMHAVSEATKAGNPDNWGKYMDNEYVIKAAKKEIKKIQNNVGIRKK